MVWYQTDVSLSYKASLDGTWLAVCSRLFFHLCGFLHPRRWQALFHTNFLLSLVVRFWYAGSSCWSRCPTGWSDLQALPPGCWLSWLMILSYGGCFFVFLSHREWAHGWVRADYWAESLAQPAQSSGPGPAQMLFVEQGWSLQPSGVRGHRSQPSGCSPGACPLSHGQHEPLFLCPADTPGSRPPAWLQAGGHWTCILYLLCFVFASHWADYNT